MVFVGFGVLGSGLRVSGFRDGVCGGLGFGVWGTVVLVEHRGDAIETETIELELVQPPPAVGEKES